MEYLESDHVISQVLRAQQYATMMIAQSRSCIKRPSQLNDLKAAWQIEFFHAMLRYEIISLYKIFPPFWYQPIDDANGLHLLDEKFGNQYCQYQQFDPSCIWYKTCF